MAKKNKTNSNQDPQTNKIPEAPKIEKESQQNSQNSNSKKDLNNLKDLEITKLKEMLSEQEIKNRTLQQEVIDWKEKSRRIYTEFQASLKQHDLEISQAKKTTKKNLVKGLSDFLNTLQLSFAFKPQTDDQKVNKFIQTLDSSYQKLINDITAQGVKIIIPEIGAEFNPETMDALETASQDENHKVKHIVSIGIEVDGQIIKPSVVILE